MDTTFQRLFRTRTSQWCLMTGKHISKISSNLWKIWQDTITSNFMLTALGGLRWRREIQAALFLWMCLREMYNQQQDSCLMLSQKGLDIGRQWYLYESIREFSCNNVALSDFFFYIWCLLERATIPHNLRNDAK